jgi:4-hydroxybenzoyl-CoA reductase subunit beta
MLRLPAFEYAVPRDLAEAVALKAQAGTRAIFLAGGTGLLPNLKRRQHDGRLVIQLGHLPELRGISLDTDGALRLGAATPLAAVAGDPRLQRGWPALARAAASVATPILREMGTIGGNLCLDTRCNYYDQSFAWRKAMGFCLKKDGETCWVAPASRRCWAVQSADSAPVVVALEGLIDVIGARGPRTIAARDFFVDDGIDYLGKRADELVIALRLPALAASRSTYLKVAQRGSFDFPVLGVAARVDLERDSGVVRQAQIVLGAVASAPLPVPRASAALVGHPLEPGTIAAAAEAAWRSARPLDNTDQVFGWRKTVVRPTVTRALEQLTAGAT